jgi:flagellar biosynthesis protein FliP
MSVKKGADVKQKQIMALRQCTECGQMISDKAASCPKCGATAVAPAPTQIPEQQTPPYNNSAQGQTIIIHQQSQTNGVGVAGFVLALLSIFFFWAPVFDWILWVLGLILSAIGVRKTPRELAIAGLVLSLIDLLLLLFVVAGIAGIAAIFSSFL